MERVNDAEFYTEATPSTTPKTKKRTTQQETFYTAKEIGHELGVSDRTVKNWAKKLKDIFNWRQNDLMLADNKYTEFAYREMKKLQLHCSPKIPLTEDGEIKRYESGKAIMIDNPQQKRFQDYKEQVKQEHGVQETAPIVTLDSYQEELVEAELISAEETSDALDSLQLGLQDNFQALIAQGAAQGKILGQMINQARTETLMRELEKGNAQMQQAMQVKPEKK